MPEIMSVIISAVISVIASTGILALVAKWWVESALNEAKQKRERETERRRERYRLEDQYRHATGRALFWLGFGARAFEKAEQRNFWDGDMEKSLEALDEAERKIKELDQQQLAEVNEPNK